MTIFERIKKLANKQGKSLQKVSEDLGLSTNYLYRLKTQQPTAEKLALIADYFHVSVDYLLGRTQFKNFDEEKTEMSKFYGMELDYIDTVIDGLPTKVIDFSQVQLRDMKLVQRDIKKALEYSNVILSLGGKTTVSLSEKERQEFKKATNELLFGLDKNFSVSKLLSAVNELLNDKNRILFYEFINKLLNEQILYMELQKYIN